MMSQRNPAQFVAVTVSALVKSCRSLALGRLSQVLAMSAAMSAIWVCSAWAASPAYTYQVVARSGDVIGSITLTNITAVSLSNDETVLFTGDIPSTPTGALFSTNFASGKKSVVAQAGQSIGGAVLESISIPSRNDSGEIVFSSSVMNNNNGEGIFTPTAALVVPGQTISGSQVSPQVFALNNAGEVAFSATPNPPLFTAIYTPASVIYTNGSKIGNYTLSSPGNPALSSSGLLAFTSTFTAGSQTGSGIFTANGLVVKKGDVVGGNTVENFGSPAISKLGVLGYEIQVPGGNRALYIDRSVIAETGDTIDGQTLEVPGDPLAPFGVYVLNAGGEALFSLNSMNVNGAQTGGYFTAKHSVLAVGDTVAGLSISGLESASFNDRGQVALVVESGASSYVVVATPVNGTPAPTHTTYKLQDGNGDIIDLGWALNPGWGDGPFAYLYPFNSSTTQQVIYTSAGKLQLVASPNMYLYNDGGYLAVGPNGDTFTIDQALGAFTVKDGSLYLQSPGKISPPNKLAFSTNIAYWSLINASPTGMTP